jgi:hypothetical protein
MDEPAEPRPSRHGVNAVLKNGAEDASILLPGPCSRMVGSQNHQSQSKKVR